jgi:hypothetical protein
VRTARGEKFWLSPGHHFPSRRHQAAEIHPRRRRILAAPPAPLHPRNGYGFISRGPLRRLGSLVAAARSKPSCLLLGGPRLVPPSAPRLGFELSRLRLARDWPHWLCCLGRQLPSRNPSRRWDLCRRPTTTSWCPCALLPPAPPTRQPVLHSSALQVHTQHLLHSSALQVSSLWCCNLPLLVMPILTEHLPLSVMPILTKHLPLPVMPILTEHFYCTVCELNTIPIWEFEM